MIIESNAVLADSVQYCQVWIDSGLISRIVTDRSEFTDPDMVLEDDYILAPGLIDAQVNGAFGKEFKTDADAISKVASQIVKFGVTGFVPTVTTKDAASYRDHLRALEVDASRATGARVLGLHLEGPALNPKKRGAHPENWLVEPSSVFLDELLSPSIRIMTIAPEQPGGWYLAQSLTARGIRVGLGHSLAEYDDVVAHFDAKSMHVVHTFNAMSELTARAPGLVGVALNRPDYWASVIADLVHVHPASLQILRAARGNSSRLFGVSDGSAVLGLPLGVHTVGARSIEKRDDRAVLAGTETLVGSVLTMNVAVRNVRQVWNCGLPEAVNFASLNAATYLGLDHEIGSIATGKRADLCVLDASFNAILTIVDGDIVFDART